jgi:ABC-2 type transport system permease protein
MRHGDTGTRGHGEGARGRGGDNHPITQRPDDPTTQSPNAQRPTPDASPIADLTYRNYDGPLHTRVNRWWIVALAGLRQSVKMKGFWIAVALALFPYFITTVQLYLQSRAQTMTGGRGINPLNMSLPGQRFAAEFFQALSWQCFFLFILALVVGVRSIAADNQTNALLVYLSKPITKGDYLLGKWMGVFLVLFAVALVPALVLYLYCLLSYLSDGFLKNEPWLIFRIVGACAVPAAIHASLIVGISAWSKTPRMAGVFYAGVYFLSGMFAAAYWGIRYFGDLKQGVLERHLSVDGVVQGLAQNIYGVTLRMMTYSRRAGEMMPIDLRPPPFGWLLVLAAALIVLGILAARLRIRAVEVVRG